MLDPSDMLIFRQVLMAPLARKVYVLRDFQNSKPVIPSIRHHVACYFPSASNRSKNVFQREVYPSLENAVF